MATYLYIPSRWARKAAFAGLLGVVLGSFLPGLAYATATYDGVVTTDTFIVEILDVTGAPVASFGDPLPAGLQVQAGTAIDVLLDSFGTGAPTGSASGDVYVDGAPTPGNGPIPAVPTVPLAFVDDGTAQLATGSGSATVEGGALSDIFTDGVFSFFNDTLDPFTVVMGLSYGWDLMVGVDDPFTELAFIDAYIGAGLADLSDPSGILITDFLFEDGFVVDTDFGPTADLFDDLVTVSFDVAPGETVYFATFNDLFGVAIAVPVPASSALMLLGIAGLVARSRRTRNKY